MAASTGSGCPLFFMDVSVLSGCLFLFKDT